MKLQQQHNTLNRYTELYSVYKMPNNPELGFSMDLYSNRVGLYLTVHLSAQSAHYILNYILNFPSPLLASLMFLTPEKLLVFSSLCTAQIEVTLLLQLPLPLQICIF